MSVSLEEWLTNGWLEQRQTSRQEMRSLLNLVDRDLAECRKPGLSADWRVTIAFNAALQAAGAALRAAGFRPSSQSHHYRTVQSLAYTIGAELSLVNELDAFRKKRHAVVYENAGSASDAEADRAVELAARLRKDVVGWLKANHPNLLPG